MRDDTRRRSDEDAARRWLRRQLEWEQTLAALRDARPGSRIRRRSRARGDAAA